MIELKKGDFEKSLDAAETVIADSTLTLAIFNNTAEFCRKKIKEFDDKENEDKKD